MRFAYLLLVLLFVPLLSGCVIRSEKTELVQTSLSDKKVVMIVAPENFRDEELFEPMNLLKRAGADVIVASKGVQTAHGMKGGSVDVDIDISDVDTDDYDGVIFVGGSGSVVYKDDPDALRIAREAAGSDDVLGALCLAPSILADAGVLKGKKATCFASEAENLKDQGADYTGEGVVVDGNIITASGPAFATKFGTEFIRLLTAQT